MLSIKYIAGFIDGEGSIKASMGTKRTPSIEICNTDRDILEEIALSIDFYVRIKLSPIFLYKKYKDHHRQAYGLYLGAPVLREFLPLLIPELRVKRFQAEALNELVNIVGMRGCKGYPETKLLKDSLTDKIMWANRGCP